eukprot:PhF_6_TR38666/c0_g1_i1/m.57839
MRRTSTVNFMSWWASRHKYRLPGTPHVTKEEVRTWKFNNKREPFGYNSVDDMMSTTSEFRKPRSEQFYTGPRPNNEGTGYWKAQYTNFDGTSQLHDHFDEYVKASNKPVAAAKLVREYWDQEEFYYQGEPWKKNRPSFRSVPQEMLNRETWYNWVHFIKGWPTYLSMQRPRQQNPMWPPPGYTLPPWTTKKVFQFGADDPGLIMELERWAWHRTWFENTYRTGMNELLVWIFCLSFMWYCCRSGQEHLNMKKVVAGLYFPGQHSVRAFGEPEDPIKEGFWWQQPLETWHNQGDIFFFRDVRYKYINYIKERDAKRAAEALAAQQAQTA